MLMLEGCTSISALRLSETLRRSLLAAQAFAAGPRVVLVVAADPSFAPLEVSLDKNSKDVAASPSLGFPMSIAIRGVRCKHSYWRRSLS